MGRPTDRPRRRTSDRRRKPIGVRAWNEGAAVVIELSQGAVSTKLTVDADAAAEISDAIEEAARQAKSEEFREE